jgi:hypothetical protein
MPHVAVSVCPGAVIVPVICVLVVGVHAICWLHRPVHAGPAHLLATPPPPQVWPDGHVPQLGVRPPQPSATTPHSAEVCAHVRGVHEPLPLPPHVNGVPPPQVSGAVQLPQSITPPQPSPIGPHVAFSDAHVTRPQAPLSSGG